MRRVGLLIVALLAAAPAAGEPAWSILRAPTITVLGDVPPKELRRVADQMEQFRAVVGAFFSHAEQRSPEPLVVLVFRNDAEMSAFQPLYRGRAIQAAGYYLDGGDIKYILLNLTGFTRSAELANHEYAHLLIENASPRTMPVWLDEGLADYFGMFQLRDGGKEAEVGRPVLDYLRLLRSAPLVPLAEVLATTARSSMYNEGGRRTMFYAESWALTHYLMVQFPDGPARVNEYLRQLADGRTDEAAIRAAFGMDLATLEKAFRHDITRPVFRSRVITLESAAAVPPADGGEPLTKGELEGWLGDLQMRLHRWADARERLAAAAAADPKAARVRLDLALVDLADKRQGAWDELARAAALEPDDFFMQYLYGSTLLAHAREETLTPEEQNARAALAYAALTRAAALGPEWTAASERKGEAAAFDEGRLAEARRLLTQAAAAAPGRLEYVARLAEVCAQQDDLTEARRLLTGLAAATWNPSMSTWAREKLDVLADSEKAEAIARAVEKAHAAASTTSPWLAMLRVVQPGEERAFGQLVNIECAPDGVAWHLKAGTREIVARSADIKGVEMMSFLEDKSVKVVCGPRVPPDAVYLTWRTEKPQAGGDAVVRDAVAVEFVPGAPPPK